MATFRHLQSERTGMKWRQVTFHDLWQPRRLPQSLLAARRVMMALPPPSGIITKPKYLPTIKEGNKASGTIYMNLHTKRKVSLLYPEKGQLIYLSYHGWQNHRRVCPETLSGRLLQEQLNQESILVEIVRPSIWQLRGSPGTWGLNISGHTQQLACR